MVVGVFVVVWCTFIMLFSGGFVLFGCCPLAVVVVGLGTGWCMIMVAVCGYIVCLGLFLAGWWFVVCGGFCWF